MESFHAPARAKVPPKSDLSPEKPKAASAGGFKDVIEDSLGLNLTDIDLGTLLTDIDPNKLKYKDYNDTPINVDCEIGDTWTKYDSNYEDATLVEWIRAKAIKYLGQDKQRQTYNNQLQDLLLDMIKGINNNLEQGRAVDQAHIERLQANRDTSGLLEFCKKICMKHQTDLHTLHQCLLAAHRHDLPSGSCKLLEERYEAYEEQLSIYHTRLQLELEGGAGLWPSPELRQKIYMQHEKILDELHGRLLSIYAGKAGWNFFDMLERASQEKDLKALHSSLLNLHKQVAKRDMLFHDFSHMQTSSVVDGIKTERPTLDTYPAPIQECLPSQASGLDLEFAINERRPSIDVIEPTLRQGSPSLPFSLLPYLSSLFPIKLDIEEMNNEMTGIRSKLPPITSNGGSLGFRWARFLLQGLNSIDKILISLLSKFFCGIYTWCSTNDALQAIIPRSISSRLSRAVEYTSEFSAWASVTCRKNLPLLEPALENGKVRVRWTCRCGKQLYDDFKEARPGAAEDLAKLLDHPQAAKSRKDFIKIATRLVESLYYLGGCSAGLVFKIAARLELALASALGVLVRVYLVGAYLVRTFLVRTFLVRTYLVLPSLVLVSIALVYLVLASFLLTSPSLESPALIFLALASLVPPAFLVSLALVLAYLALALLALDSPALDSPALALLTLVSLALASLALASERSPSSPIPSGKSSAPLATNTIAAASGHQPARASRAMLQPGPDQGKLDLQKVDPNVSSQASNHESLFLLTCITISRFATSLLQLDLKQPLPILSDRQLLELLRTHYHRLRRNWRRRLLSFQTLTSIEFVQFELHRKSIVDIRKRDDIPPEDRKDEYQYRPLPAEVIPPIGRNYLMHIYHHPEDADSETVCLTRFPKRVKDKLKLGGTDVPVGWGIEFVEGVHWNKVWCFGFAIVLISLIMGVVWSLLKRDVQGGFAIAGFMMAFLTFMVGVMQAANV